MYPDVNDIFISFFGGEPLLEKDILYYTLEKLKKIAIEKHKNFYYELDTNGIFLTKTFLEKFDNLYVSITLSLPIMRNFH